MEILENYNPIYCQRQKKQYIDKFTIIGERHSGTNWLEKIIYARLQLHLTWECNSKHFIETMNFNKMASSDDILFICIVRNIYDWIGGFYKLPHHVDKDMTSDIKSFISLPWNCGDMDYFIFKDQRYNNIFHMRSTKLFFNYFCLPNIVNNLIIIRYEDLVQNTENIMSYISMVFDIPKANYKYSKHTLPRPKKLYIFNPEILDQIKLKTDWSIELYYKYYPKLT